MEDHGKTHQNPDYDSEAPKSPKGKGKETDGETSSRSIVDRLQASGRMAVNTITTPQDWPSQIPDAKSTTGSSRSIGRGLASGGESSSSSSRMLRSIGHGESLRSPINASTSSQIFNEFLTSGAILEPESNCLPLGDLTPVVEPEMSDGAAVVRLLEAPPDELDIYRYNPGDGSDEDDALSPQAAEKLHDALFGVTGNQHRPRWDDLLNFTPGFVDGLAASSEAQMHMGTDDVGEARRMWLQQWEHVLSSYTDEVWGDLGALAAEARLEVEMVTARATDARVLPDTKALSRLRQILAHVRGH